MMHWAIYYADGSRFDNHQGDPEDAPCLGVQVIAQEDEQHGWVTQTRADYYIWDDRGSGPRWWGVDLFGLWEYLFISPGAKIVKAGRTLTSLDYNAIWKQAAADPEFGRKATFARHEMRPDD